MQPSDPGGAKSSSSAPPSPAYEAPREIMKKMRGDEGAASGVDSSALAEPFGARLRRREDPRLLNGHTTFIEGMQLPKMAGVAFTRSDQAHARIRSVATSRAAEHPGVLRVLSGEDARKLCPEHPPEAPLRDQVFNQRYPAMALDVVRYVGEIVAVVVANDRYVAEDAAALVEVEYEPLPCVKDVETALAEGATRVHEESESNVAFDTHQGEGDIDAAFSDTATVVTERYETNRHQAAPMEGRAVLASYDRITEELTVWSASQQPHVMRGCLARHLAIPEHQLRVISPDVGGGFGHKYFLTTEEILVSALSLELGRPLKWIQDRREGLSTGYHAKQFHISTSLALESDGRLRGLKTDIAVDAGAYSTNPGPYNIEAMMAAMMCPGGYKFSAARSHSQTVATNKMVSSGFRGVALPSIYYALEQTLDAAAAKLGMDPAELRRRNLLQRSDFPYQTATGHIFDSGSPLEALELALEKADYAALRAEQAKGRAEGRYMGIGLATMVEITGYGTDVAPWVFESANMRIDPGGSVTVGLGTHSHGQAHKTTFAQLAASVLGCEVESVRIVEGDTAVTPHGWGTWASRCAITGGGALVGAAKILREKLERIAAHLLEVSLHDLELEAGAFSVRGAPFRSVALGDVIASAFDPSMIPPGEEPGLEASHYHKPYSTLTNGAHVAVVDVDPELGAVKLRRYTIVEDSGRLINPMVVDGQIAGGLAMGVGQGLLEHLQYDEEGQLLTGSLMDYLLPTASDMPPIDIHHLETPSPTTVGGIKGAGEGGTNCSAGAIANAVSDALVPLCGWKPVSKPPVTPERIYEMIHSTS